jgi:hypothetical protein
MVDVTAIDSALTALKAANDIAQAMTGLRDAAAFSAKLVEFQAKVIEANNAAFAAQDERTALLQQIGELGSMVAVLEANGFQLQRYELKDFGGNTFAYQLKESEAAGEPIHRACPNCYSKGHIAILQSAFTHTIGRDRYRCVACNAEFEFGTGQQLQTTSRPLSSDYF